MSVVFLDTGYLLALELANDENPPRWKAFGGVHTGRVIGIVGIQQCHQSASIR